MSSTFHFGVVWEYLGYLLAGVKITLLVTTAALVFGSVVGLFVALGRMSKKRWLQWPAIAYVAVSMKPNTVIAPATAVTS